MAIDIKINPGNQNISYIVKNSYIEPFGKLSILLVGKFLGALNENGTIAIEDLREFKKFILSSLKKADISDFSLNSCVGNFSLICIFHDLSKILVSTSTSGISPYIAKSHQGQIKINFDENSILSTYKSNLSVAAKEGILVGHQLVTRAPLTLFDVENISRCPSGHNTIISMDAFNITFRPYLNKKDFIYSPQVLEESLKSILKLYLGRFGSDIGLAFSGGLDSSCLAALLKSMNASVPFFHVDYKGSKSKRSRVAHYIATYLGFSTLHLARHDSRVDVADMTKNCKAGFITVPNSMYLGSPINKYVKNSVPSNLITGQGADSIYVIDSFAPATELVGDARVQSIVDSRHLRLALTTPNIEKLFSFSHNDSLQSQIYSNQSFRGLVDNQCVSFNEHVDYNKFDNVKPTSLNTYRRTFISKKIFDTLLPEYFESNPHSSILSLYRYIKWMRSLINVPVQYASAQLAQGVNRLTPFLEGPIVNMFFQLEISSLESLNLKAKLEHMFFANADISHRTLVENALSTFTGSDADFGYKLSKEMDPDKYKSLANQVISALHQESQASTFMHDILKNVTSADHLLRAASLIND